MENIRIAVIGLGYVGLPLARLFATKYPVIGFDININRISELMSGNDSTLEVNNETLNAVLVQYMNVLEGIPGLFCSTKTDDIKDCNYYIVTVPTPVDRNNRPDLTLLIKASEMGRRVAASGRASACSWRSDS